MQEKVKELRKKTHLVIAVLFDIEGSTNVMVLPPKVWVESIFWPHAGLLQRPILFHSRRTKTVSVDWWRVFRKIDWSPEQTGLSAHKEWNTQ